MVLLHHVARAYHRAFPVVATLQTQRNSLYSTVCPARILNGGCTDIASGWSRAIHSKRLPMRCLALGQAPRAKYFSNYGRCLATGAQVPDHKLRQYGSGIDIFKISRDVPYPIKQSFRHQLRAWTPEEASDTHASERSQTPFVLGRQDYVDTFTLNDDFVEAAPGVFRSEDLLDVGDDRGFLVPGDLVELESVGFSQTVLAIFVRRLDRQSQFYTISGKWANKSEFSAKFFVPNFVDPQQLEPLWQYLPNEDVSPLLAGKLQNLDQSVPRSVGAHLLSAMRSFFYAADDFYRAHSHILDSLHQRVALKRKRRYATLPQIFNEAMQRTSTAENADDVEHHQLYAVYQAIKGSDYGFCVPATGRMRSWKEFEILPLDRTELLDLVTQAVRSYQSSRCLVTDNLVSSPAASVGVKKFDQFLVTVKGLIDKSRIQRLPTSVGQISPLKLAKRKASSPLVHEDKDLFSVGESRFIQFMHLWVSLDVAPAGSPINAIGAAILRATERYDGIVLDKAAGWQFLQEIGQIPPWATKSRFDLRLTPETIMPPVHTPILVKDPPCDRMDGLRKDWGSLPVYCIDSVETSEIDDGISVEPADIEGEFWLHVHVADPASRLTKNSLLEYSARQDVLTTYLPDGIKPLLPLSDLPGLSLAPGSPTLTFSARMNNTGDILEHKIEAGTVQNVVYLTPATLAELSDTQYPSPNTLFTVGKSEATTEKQRKGVQRSMLTTESLSTSQVSNLKTIIALGKGRRRKAALKGGISMSNPEGTRLGVDFPAAFNPPEGGSRSSVRYAFDPQISVSVVPRPTYSGLQYDAVASVMMIAAEVAAQWCIERNLPTIFRATQRHSDQGESARYFAEHLLKYLIKDEVPPESVLEEYMSKHAGFVLPSTTPGPHVGLGVDAYSKCTSPLRRYGDLVTHFQIESGLREEARLGRSLVGQNGSRDFLEFSREDIDKLIPHLNNQEKIKRTAEKSAVRSWALMALLRAWKFGEAQLPDKLHFMVSARHASSAVGDVPELALHGVVNWYGSKDDSWLRIGDIWQVQIKNICPYSSIFELEPIKMVRSAEERRAEGVITSLYPRFV